MKKTAILALTAALFCAEANAKSLNSDYSLFKYWLNKNYGIDYGVDVSVMGQRGAPSGKYNSGQAYIYPYLT